MSQSERPSVGSVGFHAHDENRLFGQHVSVLISDESEGGEKRRGPTQSELEAQGQGRIEFPEQSPKKLNFGEWLRI